MKPIPSSINLIIKHLLGTYYYWSTWRTQLYIRHGHCLQLMQSTLKETGIIHEQQVLSQYNIHEVSQETN